MLRSTLSKIKKAWALALASRGRNDLRCLPGKFNKLSIPESKKSAKPLSEHEAQCHKCKQIIEYIFGPSTTVYGEKEGRTKPQVYTSPETQCEKCKRLISEAFGTDEEVAAKGMPDSVKRLPLDDVHLQATTAKLDEEKLAQKIEHIDEPALVEAARETIDGYNAPPRVLGNIAEISIIDDTNCLVYELVHEVDDAKIMRNKIEELVRRIEDANRGKFFEPTVFASDDSAQKQSGSHEDTSFDAIAKRCLNSPTSQLDAELLKEMKKLGVPQTGLSPNAEDENIIQVLKRPRKPAEKTEIDMESRKFDIDPHHTFTNPYTYNPYLQNVAHDVNNILNSSRISDSNKDLTANEVIDTDYSPRPRFDFNASIIDPFDKRSLIYETDNFGYETLTYTSNINQLNEENYGGAETNDTQYNTMNIETNNSNEYYTFSESNNESYWQKHQSSQKESQYNQQSIEHENTCDNNITSNENTPNSIDIHINQEPAKEIIQQEIDTTQTEPNKWEVYTNEANLSQAEVNTSDCKEQIAETPDAVQTSNTDVLENTNISRNATAFCSVTNAQENTRTEEESTKPREQYSHSFIQPEAMVNPLINKETLADPADEIQKNIAESFDILPKLNPEGEEVSLSEMLKRVRMRNRIEYCKAKERQVDPVEGKCGKKTPPCPPPAPVCPPPNPCPPPPAPCPPPPPPCPRPCRPTCPPPCPPQKPNPCAKCTAPTRVFKNINMIPIFITFSPKLPHRFSSLPIKDLTQYEDVSIRAVLTKEIVVRIQDLGYRLVSKYHSKIGVDLECRNDVDTVTLARDFDPWVPIPCWPIPKKEEKRPLVCPKEGCKLLPPPRLTNPCDKGENPCLNFPKRSNFAPAKVFFIRSDAVFEETPSK